MKKLFAVAAGLAFAASQAWTAPALAAPAKGPAAKTAATQPGPAAGLFEPRAVKSSGTVTVEGHKIAYEAVAGTIIVHPQGWDDAAKPATGKDAIGSADGPPVASMFYVAYFKHGADARNRPITFLYNGGPGSSTVWLHMGAFGPVRVVTSDDTHTPPAPVWRGQQRLQPARCQRPGLHRRAGHRLTAASRARARRRPSTAWIRTGAPSPLSSSSS